MEYATKLALSARTIALSVRICVTAQLTELCFLLYVATSYWLGAHTDRVTGFTVMLKVSVQCDMSPVCVH